MIDERVHFGSLDACLGPGDSRFFGSGYKRVGQRLHDLRTDVSAAPGSSVTARASLDYPAGWSRKGAGRELRPHLSSIDALVLAVALAEVHVNAAHGLTVEQQRRTWVRGVEIRVGAGPHEDLADFPVWARLRAVDAAGPTDPAGSVGAGLLTSHYACRIGTLTVRCRLAHCAGRAVGAGQRRYADLADALGPAATRHYGAGYKAHQLRADAITVDVAGERVLADQHVDTGPAAGPGAGRPMRGAEAAYGPSVSLVDALVSAAQLAQALLYALDRMDRGHSDTLWMRRMSMVAGTPLRPAPEPFPVLARATHNRVLELGGRSWRALDLVVDGFAGINGSCSLAHRLPNSVPI